MEKKYRQPKALNIVLGLSMLFIGICGISYEYTFSKLASDILGNSVRQWAIIIGLMMFCMGVGADLQKYLPDKVLVDSFIIIEILLGILGGIGPTVTLWAFGEIHSHFILFHYFFICIIGVLIGLEIPLLTRVNHLTVPSLKYNLSLILKMDYIGSFIGALVWVFVLHQFFNILETGFFIGIVNITIALLTFFFFSPWVKQKKRILIFAIAGLLILVLGMVNGKKIAVTSEQKLYQDPIIYTKTTPYQRIVATESRYGDLYFYINGHLQFSSVDEFIYHEFLVHPAVSLAKQKKRVLVLGGGDGLAVREILKYPEVERVDLVDIDPEMTRLAKNMKPLARLNQDSLSDSRVVTLKSSGISQGDEVTLKQFGKGFFKHRQTDENSKIHILNLDAYAFVEKISGMYDVIILDFPDPNDLALSKLYSREFYHLLKKKLAFDGVMIQQSTSPTFAKETFLVIGRTMEDAGLRAIPMQHNVPSFGNWGWWVATHQNNPEYRDLKGKMGKNSIPENVQYITNELIKSSLVFGKNALLSEHQDINTILQDRAYYYYVNAWEKYQ